MPTGLKDSQPDMQGAAGMVSRQPRPSINISCQIVFAADNVPQCFPPHFVPPGLVPMLRGVNGQTANVNSAFVSDYRDGLLHNGFRTITPDTEISFPSDNLGKIWCMGKAGDGVIASVNGAQIG